MLFAKMPLPPMGSHPRPRRGPGHGQKPLSVAPTDDEVGSWVHTYIAGRDLRLIYVDGMSAAKTNNGTQSTQDRIFLNDTFHESQVTNEIERAKEMCRIIRETWDDRLDGILRMEAGFEIILCSFERDLEFIRAVRMKPEKIPLSSLDNDDGYGYWWANKTIGQIFPDTGSWVKAITARYHGIGGNRVRLNYNNFVTAFTHDLDIFGGESKKYRPRLEHLDSSLLEPVRQELNTLVMTHDASEISFDWQAVADMIIERYSHTLKYLASGVPNETQVREAIGRLLQPFIEYHGRNVTLEAERCKTQFIPFSAPMQGTAALTVRAVAEDICWTLLEAWEADYKTTMGKITDLVEYLSWSTWKECIGCKDNEICMIPIWPMGIEEDYDHPACRDVQKLEVPGREYWGGFSLPSPT